MEGVAVAAVALVCQKATKGRSEHLTSTTITTTTIISIATNSPLSQHWMNLLLLLLLLHPLDTQHPLASPSLMLSLRLWLSSPPNSRSTPSKLFPDRSPSLHHSPCPKLDILPCNHATSPSFPMSPKPRVVTQHPSPLLPDTA